MVNLLVIAAAVGAVYLVVWLMEGYKEMNERVNHNGTTIFQTAMLEWIQEDSTRWRADHPYYHSEGSPCYFCINEFQGKYYLTFEGVEPLAHREPFESFFLAAFWAEAGAIRDCIGFDEDAVKKGKVRKQDLPEFARQYYNGCRAAAIFSPDRNQGTHPPAEQPAEKIFKSEKQAIGTGQ